MQSRVSRWRTDSPRLGPQATSLLRLDVADDVGPWKFLVANSYRDRLGSCAGRRRSGQLGLESEKSWRFVPGLPAYGYEWQAVWPPGSLHDAQTCRILGSVRRPTNDARYTRPDLESALLTPGPDPSGQPRGETQLSMSRRSWSTSLLATNFGPRRALDDFSRRWSSHPTSTLWAMRVGDGGSPYKVHPGPRSADATTASHAPSGLATTFSIQG